MNQAGVTSDLCPAYGAALLRAQTTGAPAGAMQLDDGTIITGKTSPLLGASSALLLNAVKTLAGIDKEQDIIGAEAIEPIARLKTTYLGHRNPRLHCDELLIALSMSSLHSPLAAKALEQLGRLRGYDAHFSVILSTVDEKVYRKLGINVTCEPKFEGKKHFG